MSHPDESMSLLREVTQTALEPGYTSRPAHERHPRQLVLVILLIGILIAVAVVHSTRTATELDRERQDLVDRVEAGQAEVTELESELAGLEDEVRSLRQGLTQDREIESRTASLEPIVGSIAVTGPGITVTVDDGTEGEGLVYDTDLSILVNGLWQAGAEAVAINGRRVSALTSIRTAGSAITVDFISLSPPYRVEAIGDPKTLSARFARTPAAAWWQFLRENYGAGFVIDEVDQIALAADPGMHIRVAEG
ncbi:MAG: DUF881 domain-containing protein [Arachnia sp.]